MISKKCDFQLESHFFNASELFKQIQKLKKHELISLIKR
jgi:hypothetical protein